MLAASVPAYAQSSLFSATPSTGMVSPGSGGQLAPSQSPLPLPSSQPPLAMPMVPAGQVALTLSARFGKDAPPVGGGLTWRI